MEVATSRDRDMLVEELTKVYNITTQLSGPLDKAIKNVMGAEEWEKVWKPNLKVHEAIVGLLDFLASNQKEMGASFGSIVGVAASSLAKLTTWTQAIQGYEHMWEDPWKALESVKACPVIVKALLAYPTHEKTQFEGWVAVSKLMKGEKQVVERPLTGEVTLHGAVAMVEALDAGAFTGAAAAMLAFSSHRGLQLSCCNILKEMAINIVNNDSDDKRLSASGCQAVIAALRAFPADVEVQGCGIATIASLSICRPFDSVWKDYPASPLIIKAMKAFPINYAIQAEGCRALATLALHEDREQIGKDGGCDVVIAAMKGFLVDSRMQLDGCSALDHLLGVDKPHEENRARIVKGGGCQVIIKAMQHHPRINDVQHEANSLIRKLAVDAEAAKVVVEGGWIEAIIGRLERTYTDDDELESAFDFLVSLVGELHGETAHLLELAVLKVVMATIDGHSGDAGILKMAWNALDSLLKGYSGDKAKLMETGLLAAVVEGCDDNIYHFGSESVAAMFSAIDTLIGLYEGNEAKLVEARVLEGVVKVYIRDSYDKDVEMKGCSIVINLIQIYGEKVVDILDEDFISMVKLVSLARRSEEVKALYSVIEVLITTHASTKAKLVEAGVVNAVNEAMTKFGNNADIQRQGNELLGQLQQQQQQNGRRRCRSKRQRLSEP